MKSDLVDVDAELTASTEKAFGLNVGTFADDGKPLTIWVPKSQVEDNQDGTFTMPEWLALDKGLI